MAARGAPGTDSAPPPSDRQHTASVITVTHTHTRSGSQTDHQCVVVEVPGLYGQCVRVRVHNGVLQDVDGPGHVRREDALRPARQQVGLCQQSP